MKIFEAFAGIGTQSIALQRLGKNVEVFGISEWFIEAILAYGILHGFEPEKYIDIDLEEKLVFLETLCLSKDTHTPAKSIRNLSREKVEDLFAICKKYKNFGSILNVKGTDIDEELDIFTYSFPCTDLSTGGKGMGMSRASNTRSGMLWEVERILKEMDENELVLPKVLLMENVKPILSESHASDFKEWINFLEKLGYNSSVQILNSLDFGSSQSRDRVFLVSVRKDIKFDAENFIVQTKKRKTPTEAMKILSLDYSTNKYRYEAEKASLNPTPSRERMFPVNYRDLEKPVKYFGTVTTNLDRQNNAGMIYYKSLNKERYYRLLTDRETWKLMGLNEEEFEKVKYFRNIDKLEKTTLENFEKIEYFSYRKMNRLSGNAIVVDVLAGIFNQLIQENILN